jgi:hypothetical protein
MRMYDRHQNLLLYYLHHTRIQRSLFGGDPRTGRGWVPVLVWARVVREWVAVPELYLLLMSVSNLPPDVAYD